MAVGECDLHGAHGADVETKQTTSDDGDGRDEVHVPVLLHHGGRFLVGVWWIEGCKKSALEDMSDGRSWGGSAYQWV